MNNFATVFRTENIAHGGAQGYNPQESLPYGEELGLLSTCNVATEMKKKIL